MRCPTLADLPAPPPGREGWPWTQESDPTLGSSSLPRISVVTPSFNQAEFLEETLRSILLQAYPDLELIVMDGGSTDGSVEIIQRYAPWLSFWTSGPDRGQSHAINSGFTRATGDVFAWLNSDDIYCPNALRVVGQTLIRHPMSIVAGDVLNVLELREGPRALSTVSQQGLSFDHLVRLDEQFAYAQPGLFFPANAWRAVGGLDEDLAFAMDHDLLCRIVQHAPVVYVKQVVARFRMHELSKTATQWLPMLHEQVAVSRRYWSMAGGVDEQHLSAHVVRTMVRQAGTDISRGKVSSAVGLLARSAAIDARGTAGQLIGQFAAGVRRHAVPH
jgi:GT2 family glycosyltransferase